MATSPNASYRMADADTIQRLNAALEGRYRIEREVGARDGHGLPGRGCTARPTGGAQGARGRRWLREIDTVARLTHPHILPLHDSGEADGLLYYVMPYVEGDT